MEMIKTFNGNHIHVGEAERSVAHAKGLWHETFHCWFVAELGGVPCVLVQLRSPLKESYPNLLDVTAAGHLESHEEPLDGVREVKEELGIEINLDHLTHLGIKIEVQDEPGGLLNREFSHVFLYQDDRPLDRYVLQKEEVSALIAIPVGEGLALLFDEQQSVTCEGITFGDDDAPVTFHPSVTRKDFVPLVDGYYQRVFTLADLYFRGYRYLSI